ncbi:hypothetical protein GCM10023063_30840 [Arthrobacter methylotrophus]
MDRTTEQHHQEDDAELEEQGLRREARGKLGHPASFGGDRAAGGAAALFLEGYLSIEALSTMSKMLSISSMSIKSRKRLVVSAATIRSVSRITSRWCHSLM